MLLIKLEESHYLAKVKIAIQVVIESSSEIVNWVRARVYAIACTIVDKVGNSIEVTTLKTLRKERLQEGWIDWRK